MTDAFYQRQSDRFVPTAINASPWTANAQLGVALAGLATHALETAPMPQPMVVARLTIDIMGAVPIVPLTACTRIVRDGRRLQLIDSTLEADGRTWVRATALRVRAGSSPAAAMPPTHPLPGMRERSGGLSWVETVRLVGDYRQPGPGASWVRILAPVIAGAPLTPLQRVAMIADFGSGTAPLVPVRDWTFANVDISIHLTRAPEGEWLLLDAASESAGNGIGLTHARIGDHAGMIGSAHQTTFLELRRAASPGRNEGAELDRPTSRMSQPGSRGSAEHGAG